MTGPARSYHHGNLHAALIEAGMALLATRTLDELSLREIARTVGVSATAVYRHFPDKRALMVALAGEGLARLAAAQRAASAEAGGGAAGFGATGGAYVRFALANPTLFRLIFANPAAREDAMGHGDGKGSRQAPKAPCDPLGRPAGEAADAIGLLRANAAEFARPGTDPAVLALRAWSLTHGLAMLMLDGKVPAAEATIDAVLDDAFGLKPGAR